MKSKFRPGPTLRSWQRFTAVGALLLACEPAAPPAPRAPVAPPTATTGADDANYETAPPELRQAPPTAVATPPWAFPAIVDGALDNGLRTKVVTRSTLPLVELRLVVFSGQATDGAQPGLAALAGEMLKVGGTDAWTSRELLDRVESLGATLDVATNRDSTVVSLAVTSDLFEAALALLAKVVQKPRLDAGEFTKLQRREVDRVASLGRSSGAWVASRVLYEKLFATSSEKHPYATFDATAPELEKRTLRECRTWLSRYVSPKNSLLQVTGDVTAARVARAAAHEFQSWRGAPAPSVKFPAVKARPSLEVYLVDRPKSPQAEVMLAFLGPERQSPEYVALSVTNQILGGGVSGRLFGDVREKRSLAYSTYSTFDRVSQGPLPLVLKAGTQTAKAGLTLQALIEHAERLTTESPTDAELELARRFLSDAFLLRAETVGAIAAMTTDLAVFGLPNDYYDRFRVQLGTTSAAQALDIGKRYYSPSRAIAVVAGDAERLTVPLSHFADVIVVDPAANFGVRQTVPKNPEASVELPRLDGT